MKIGWWALSGAVALAIIIVGVGLTWSRQSNHEQVLRIADSTFQATVLREDAEIMRGLSGTKSLANDHAVLFVFPHDSDWGMWMKDMNYPIDIIWLDRSGKVVHLQANADPSSYNRDDPSRSKIYRPSTDARYVIETVSGTIERTGIEKGDVAELPSGIIRK